MQKQISVPYKKDHINNLVSQNIKEWEQNGFQWIAAPASADDLTYTLTGTAGEKIVINIKDHDVSIEYSTKFQFQFLRRKKLQKEIETWFESVFDSTYDA